MWLRCVAIALALRSEASTHSNIHTNTHRHTHMNIHASRTHTANGIQAWRPEHCKYLHTSPCTCRRTLHRHHTTFAISMPQTEKPIAKPKTHPPNSLANFNSHIWLRHPRFSVIYANWITQLLMPISCSILSIYLYLSIYRTYIYSIIMA